jgi:hypothetical protein
MPIGQRVCRDYPGYECPVCGSRHYYRISVTRERQPPYLTAFFGCVGCSVMFTDAFTFTQSGMAAKDPKRTR